MKARSVCLTLVLTGAAAAAQAAGGLVPPAAEALWPHWQARITVQTAGNLPLSAARLVDPNGAILPDTQRALQGGAVLGDYTFATPSFGAFRASGGLMKGALGGAPMASAAVGPRLGVTVASGVGPVPGVPGGAGVDAAASATVPYLGLGFTGTARRSAFAFSADLGLVAEHSSGLGRAVFGNQGFESALRELRLSPVLQLGMRYSF